MRPAVLLAQLSLWTSAHAFWPYDPEWRRDLTGSVTQGLLSSSKATRSQNAARFNIKQRTAESNQQPAERAAQQAARLATKYERQAANAPADGAVVKRANNYDVMKAEDPTGKYTAGIDQDGTDYSYFVEVEIGDKKKTMYMLVDTGAGSSWVMGSGCKSDACGLHTLFGTDDSSTLDLSSDPFSIAYGSGKVSGKLANDTFKVAGMSFQYQFGVADTTSDQFVSFAFDGILGLSLNTGANQNFLEAVSSSHDLGQNLFSIALNRAADGTNNGEIMFGATNTDKYEGDITYTSLEEGDDWSIQLGDMGYDGNAAKIGGLPSYIDTGTSFMFGPADSVKALHALIPGASSTDNATWTVPCDSDKNLTITFSGAEYVISSKDWISPKSKSGTCTSNVYGHEVVKGAWLLGDTFLKNVYAVFDKDKRRIGFAKSVIGAANGTDGTTTASENAGSTRVSPSGTTATVDTGLGKESVSTSTATGGSTQSTSSSKDSSASGLSLTQAHYTFAFCIITFFAVMA